MKRFFKYILYVPLTLVLVYLGYMTLSRILYRHSWSRGDYPGPRLISNFSTASKQVDWLLLHGASLDARMWLKVIKSCPSQHVLAASLANHNMGSKLAEPGIEPSQDIVKLLNQYKVKQGIIGHSSAAVWLANAYAACPKCFQNLQIYLLVPNLCFMQVNEIDKVLLKVVPTLFWAFDNISPCTNSHDMERCKRDFLAGRNYRIGSTKYYEKLLTLCSQLDTNHHINNFVTKLAKQIHFILADGDALIDNKALQQYLRSYHSQAMMLPHTSHHESYLYAANIMHCTR